MISVVSSRARRFCRLAEPVCPPACTSALRSAPFTPRAASLFMHPHQRCFVHDLPWAKRRRLAPMIDRHRTTLHDVRSAPVRSRLSVHVTALCGVRSPIGPPATAESPTRATTLLVTCARLTRAPPTSLPASGGYQARCVLPHIIPDERSPTPAGATNRCDSWSSSTGTPTPSVLDPDFLDDESTVRSDDATGARRRLHRPERRLPRVHR